MQDDIRRLEDKIDALTKIVLDRITMPSFLKTVNQSEKQDELNLALSKAQEEYTPIVKLEPNTYSEIAFASMQEVVSATRPSLSKYNLSVIQILFDHTNVGLQILHTQLRHSSGQFVESQVIVKPNGNDPVALTSYTNWLKRTAYSCITGCPIPKEDDDAVKNCQVTDDKPASRNSTIKKKDASFDLINKQQYDEIILELEGYPKLAQMVLDQLEIENFNEMRQSKFPGAIKGIREQKFKMKVR